MDPFEELVEQLREIGRREAPRSPDFVARTMERLAAIRPFGVPSEPVPAPRPMWRTWWGAASAAAVVLVAVAVWAIPHALHRRGGADTAPATNAAPATNRSVLGTVEAHHNTAPVPDVTTQSVSPSWPADTDTVVPTPPTESVEPEQKAHYAADPSFIQADRRPLATGAESPERRMEGTCNGR